jgi:hypothetical protein
MTDLEAGDEIELHYDDSPETVIRATVDRISTDRKEGMGPEIEDYIACWIDITLKDGNGDDARQVVTFGADFKYWLNARQITISKSLG